MPVPNPSGHVFDMCDGSITTGKTNSNGDADVHRRNPPWVRLLVEYAAGEKWR